MTELAIEIRAVLESSLPDDLKLRTIAVLVEPDDAEHGSES